MFSIGEIENFVNFGQKIVQVSKNSLVYRFNNRGFMFEILAIYVKIEFTRLSCFIFDDTAHLQLCIYTAVMFEQLLMSEYISLLWNSIFPAIL